MTATTARRSTAKSASPRETLATLKSTPYGKAVLRAIDRMKAAGPWEFGASSRNRCFKSARDAVAHLKRL